MKIINLTQHAATDDQLQAGVIEPGPVDKTYIRKLITFDELPTENVIRERADKLARLARFLGAKGAMIGGAPFFMATLECALRREGVEPFYSFSTRVVDEVEEPDGKVVKKSVFKHAGFVPAVRNG